MPPESNASIPAQIGRNLCDQLFAAEKEIQRLPPEQRQEKRLAVEQPMLRAFWCWLDELSTQPLAGSLKKAVEYAQGQRSYMENYLKDPRYEISNNRAENKIHPFTVGRKNWLFSDTPAGAKASAVICHQFALGVANGQHLLWVEVLNVIDVFGVFHPLAPNTQQTGRCQVLDNIFHK